jgi:hypothetical protein
MPADVSLLTDIPLFASLDDDERNRPDHPG